jgi:hypothetical protein
MSNSTARFNIIASGDALLKVHSYELRIKQEGRTKQADKGYKQEGNKTGRQSREQHSLIAWATVEDIPNLLAWSIDGI